MLSRMNDYAAAQMALGFFRFFTHQVAHSSPTAFDFTRARHLETLLGAGMGLHLRHRTQILKMERKDKRRFSNKKRLRKINVAHESNETNVATLI